ncbi:NAD(P)H-dependent oxidoreductase [Chryseobacterium lactis]|uniref:NAD(P)H-dependent oxidoreductase n=1 Tax=Chryseobacterium lactis TaxID=1241981 RepID=A0A3G6RLR6_CHRLC|nr:NAD(P)H-dependent oxidoreductase [Chryseobacterium lactis]AZA82089.1 NAD(P)H-dependent oxidoreductase [Chryseobacterium lactis]AZB02470.1 NAD(P)H-dependent oxidoreductase [Chryseobacterium lactis]PNW14234.1 NAD(P)H-dependent oxidoreductase [Chryseobacterium lactis]
MNFLNKMKSRYTVKKYNPQETVSEEKIQQLKEILQLSPSSINSQPWNFIFVNNDSKVKDQLAEASYWNKEKVLESSHLIIFQALKNPEDFEKQIEGVLPEGSVNYYNNFVKPKGETGIKSWLKHQVYLSLGVFLSACADMEIDSTPMEGIEPDKYDQILNNEKYETLFAVAIGKRDETDANQPKFNPKTRLKTEKVIVEA